MCVQICDKINLMEFKRVVFREVQTATCLLASCIHLNFGRGEFITIPKPKDTDLYATIITSTKQHVRPGFKITGVKWHRRQTCPHSSIADLAL